MSGRSRRRRQQQHHQQQQQRSADLVSLRERHTANRLRLAILEQESAMQGLSTEAVASVLESYDLNNIVDPRDYFPLGATYCDRLDAAGGRRTSITDRDDGRNLPVFQTEAELASIRGLARFLYDHTEVGKGVVDNLANYVVGAGPTVTISSRQRDADDDLVGEAQSIVTDFLDVCQWNGGHSSLGRELFIRRRVDGEHLLGLWHVGGGRVEARVIEPDQLTEPTGARAIERDYLACEESSWSFGVHTTLGDVVSIHGYYCQWSPNPTDWDYLPGGPEPFVPSGASGTWCHHGRANVTQNVKRGLSDFFCTRNTINLARKVLRNTGEGAAIQAAIAFFREHSQAAARSIVDQFRARTRTGAYGVEQHFAPGTIVDHGRDVQFKYGPMGQNNAVIFVDVVEALLRSAAVRWQMPEHMITGSAANNNYASIFVSESPFVRTCQAMQADEAGTLQAVLWQVLRFACEAGRFGEMSPNELRKRLTIAIKFPSLVVREPEKEVNRIMRIRDGGLISDETAAAELGYDYQQEQARGARRVDPNGQEVGIDVGLGADAGTGIDINAETGGSAPAVDAAAVAAAGSEQNIQTAEALVLNGAQIQSALAIVLSVARGEMPRDAGVGQLQVLFNLKAEQAEQIMGSAGTATPTTPNPRPQTAEAADTAVAETPAMESERSATWLQRMKQLWRGYP